MLNLAIHLAEELNRLHQHNVLHGHLNPGNVVVDSQARPTLVDPETAAVLAKVAGRRGLAYIAPEQSGGWTASPTSGRTCTHWGRSTTSS